MTAPDRSLSSPLQCLAQCHMLGAQSVGSTAGPAQADMRFSSNLCCSRAYVYSTYLHLDIGNVGFPC